MKGHTKEQSSFQSELIKNKNTFGADEFKTTGSSDTLYML